MSCSMHKFDRNPLGKKKNPIGSRKECIPAPTKCRLFSKTWRTPLHSLEFCTLPSEGSNAIRATHSGQFARVQWLRTDHRRAWTPHHTVIRLASRTPRHTIILIHPLWISNRLVNRINKRLRVRCTGRNVLLYAQV